MFFWFSWFLFFQDQVEKENFSGSVSFKKIKLLSHIFLFSGCTVIRKMHQVKVWLELKNQQKRQNTIKKFKIVPLCANTPKACLLCANTLTRLTWCIFLMTVHPQNRKMWDKSLISLKLTVPTNFSFLTLSLKNNNQLNPKRIFEYDVYFAK